jgi:rubrerythrin
MVERMNPRIQELAEQAERLAKDELAHLERVHNRLYSLTEDREIYNEKFAQLIVRECANRIDYWESRQGEHSDDLLKHFGVLE